MRTIIFILGCFFALQAHAQSVKVLSGEHASFTRLAMIIPGLQRWEFGRTETGYELQVSPSSAVFDTQDVFRLIPRRRLTDLVAPPGGGVLSLQIDCDCHAVASEIRPRVIVVDIFDGPAPAALMSEMRVRPDANAFVLVTTAANQRPKRRPGMPAAALLPGFVGATTWQPRLPDQDFLDRLGVGAQHNHDDMTNPLQAALLMELARATARGTLAPAAPPAASTSKASLANPLSVPAFPKDQVHVEFRTRQDGLTLAPPTSEECPGSELLDLASWADDRPFALQLAERRTQLVGEFDKPDVPAIERMIQLYLAGGFGAEAVNIATELLDNADYPGILADIGRIVDDTAPAGSALGRFNACSGRIALWAVLSSPDGALAGRPNVKDIVLAFSELPVVLRREIGPRLVQTLLDIDEPESAHSIKDALTRARDGQGPALDMMSAQLATRSNQPETAENHLRAAAKAAGPPTPMALADLVESLVSRGVAPDEATLTSLESYLAEHRRTPLGPKLQRAFVLGLAQSGQFDRAFGLSPDTDVPYLDELFANLVTNGNDAEFLAHALANPERARTLLSKGTQSQIAQRFIDLGLPEIAAPWTEGMETEPGRLLETGVEALIKPPPSVEAPDGLIAADATTVVTIEPTPTAGPVTAAIAGQDVAQTSPAATPTAPPAPEATSEPGSLKFARDAGAMARSTIDALEAKLRDRPTSLLE